MKLTIALMAVLLMLAGCGSAETSDTAQVPTTTGPVTATTAPAADDGLDLGPFVGSDPDSLIVDVAWLDATHPSYEAQLPADSSGVGVLAGSEPDRLFVGVNAGGCTPEVTVSVSGSSSSPELILALGPPIVPEGLDCTDVEKMYVFAVSLSEPVPVENVAVRRSTDDQATGDHGLDVIVSADGPVPDEAVVGCNGSAMFPMSALSDIELFDAAALPEVDAAMRTFLDDEEGRFWAQEGWMVLHSTESAYLLVAVGESGGLEFIDLEKIDGEWVWTGASGRDECQLQAALPDELGQVTWRLDPAEPEPGPESSSVVVLVTETACASGNAIGDRLLGPQIVVSDSEVAIAFAVQPIGGFQECQGNPEQRVVVELPELLGDRSLVDGLDLDLDLIDLLS